MKTTVIHHSADYDGIFCREIARKFLPGAELIGWDFANAPLAIPKEGRIYILDLPVDRVFGKKFEGDKFQDREIESISDRIIWIDHHKSSIESHPATIPGYRIDGVAACRLAWQWFESNRVHGTIGYPLSKKQQFIDREVKEPLSVRLAGEYDIWDKRDPDAELFQHGLRSQDFNPVDWEILLENRGNLQCNAFVNHLLENGKTLQYAKTHENESIINEIGFTVPFEGITFLACNHARYNSFLFTAGLKPEHDACLGFKWTGKDWSVSLYHAPGKEHHDLSKIAVKFGGGGHRGACGFRARDLPWFGNYG
jgi:hypothetical protein